jgi:hypothetical protein
MKASCPLCGIPMNWTQEKGLHCLDDTHRSILDNIFKEARRQGGWAGTAHRLIEEKQVELGIVYGKKKD